MGKPMHIAKYALPSLRFPPGVFRQEFFIKRLQELHKIFHQGFTFPEGSQVWAPGAGAGRFRKVQLAYEQI